MVLHQVPDMTAAGQAGRRADLLGISCKRWRANKLEVLVRPPQGGSVEISKPFMLEFIPNDSQLIRVVSCQLVEAAQAEQKVLKAVTGMLLQSSETVCHCETSACHA